MTHLAVNDPIPPLVFRGAEEGDDGKEEEEEGDFNNVLRSPTNLTPLYGIGVKFDELWVSTRQNALTQVWAPLYTMFSRGNVKEKARVLGFKGPRVAACGRVKRGGGGSRKDDKKPGKVLRDAGPQGGEQKAKAQARGNTAPLPSPPPPFISTQKTDIRREYAVDLYAGIGYFAFSYAELGYRVLCWELNPYSVEGLRRGALANNFSVRVVSSPEELSKPAGELGLSSNGEGGEQIVVFLEDNKEAARRVREMGIGKVRHVNAGFLPTSQGVWRDGFEIVRAGLIRERGNAEVEVENGAEGVGQGTRNGTEEEAEEEEEEEEEAEEAWLHLHENVGVEDIENRRKEVEGMFKAWAGETGVVETGVEHVELVKTYAPGVWHVVFDVLVRTG